MVLKQMLERFRDRRSNFKHAQVEDRTGELISERKKSANERELDRFMEEDREKQILSNLIQFRAKRAEEDRKTTVLGGKNIFTGHKSIMENNDKLFSGKMDNAKGGMFFK